MIGLPAASITFIDSSLRVCVPAKAETRSWKMGSQCRPGVVSVRSSLPKRKMATTAGVAWGRW